MSAQLVTVATFSSPTEASIVRNRLDAAGIRTFLADEATVGMAWHLGIAVGGVKLQVAEHDAERALAELASLGPSLIREDEWRTEDHEDSDASSDSETEDEEAEEEPATTPTDEAVSRALDAAVIGLLLFPLQLYSLWLLVRIVKSPPPLTPKNRNRVLVTLLLDLPVIIGLSIWLWSMFSG